MTIVLGDNQYGKAETHVVRVSRSGATHDIRDLNVSVALAGDFADTHITGDNSKVVPTDTQKNTLFAFAREPIGGIEDFGIRLARHFVSEFASVYRARVHIEEHAWERIHDHAFVQSAAEKRLATVTCTDDGTWVVSGIGGHRGSRGAQIGRFGVSRLRQRPFHHASRDQRSDPRHVSRGTLAVRGH